MPRLSQLKRSVRTGPITRPNSNAKTSAPPPSLTRRARKQLLETIGEFVLRHDLDITGSNLAVICDALSGSDTRLARAFVEREAFNDRIDQAWLDTLKRRDNDTGQRLSALDALMDRLEETIVRFNRAAGSAAIETSDQRGTLDATISKMDKAASGDSLEVTSVLDLSRTVLESLSRVETAMAKSQAESQALRENLAKARMEADLDHLTGLPNRRAFERRLAHQAVRARDEGASLCIAFCDIDNFKAINDTHGHDAGDRILREVAATLDTVASKDCFAARHGGEEFVMLFYGLDLDRAFRKLDGVRRAMAMKQLTNRETGKPFGKVTFSGGIAQVTDANEPRLALSEADAALYQAKEEGRNRIVMAG